MLIALLISSAFALNPDSKVITELFEATNLKQTMTESTRQMADAQIATSPELQKIEPEFRAFLMKMTDFDTLEPQLRKLYADNFSEQELKDATKFYRTPSGKSMLLKTPSVMAQSQTMISTRIKTELPAFLKSVEAKLTPAKK